MRCSVFRPKRRVDGKVRTARLYSGRVRLPGWPTERTYALHVTDKRVAEQKLREIVRELEMEAAGIGVPRLAREAAHKAISEHLAAFLSHRAARCRPSTLKHYRKHLTRLCARCGWVHLCDVTARSFEDWRKGSGLSPKFQNDLLSFMRTFLGWLRRQKLVLGDPLEGVAKLRNESLGTYRRALSVDQVQKLLAVASPERSAVYLLAIYTGLRRTEMNRLRWGDFNLDAKPPRVVVPAAVTKNGKPAILELRSEAVDALRRLMPDLAQPFEWALRGRVPSVRKLRQDLAASGIPYQDERGRRVDLHALRTTFGTMLSAAGVSPRVAMELMRHSDIRLTMRIYTDAAQLPLSSEIAKLPAFSIAENSTQISTQLNTQTGVASGVVESHAVADRRELANS